MNTLSNGGGAWRPEIKRVRHMSDVGYLVHRPIWDTTSVSAGQNIDKTSIFEHKVIKLWMEGIMLEEPNWDNKNGVYKKSVINKRFLILNYNIKQVTKVFLARYTISVLAKQAGMRFQ